jgi:hypothetical protein
MMPWKITRRAVSALLLCSLICAGQVALAEEPMQGASTATGELQVTVTDQNGQPLRMAIVMAQQNEKTIAQ